MAKYFHASPVSNRSSIEKNGLLPSESMTSYDNEDGSQKHLKAVFVSRSQHFMQGVADHLALNKVGASDIYEVNTAHPPKDDPNWEGADMITRKIPAKNVQRVGHITELGETHWHIAEKCASKKG